MRLRIIRSPIMSYQSLVELVNANVTVNDLDRGLTDYYAGYQYTQTADLEPALMHSIVISPPTPAMMERHITIKRLRYGECKTTTAQSMNLLTSFSIIHPIRIGWMDGIKRRIRNGTTLTISKAATDTLLGFVKAAAASDQAPDALMSAASIFEQDNQTRTSRADLGTRSQ